MEERDFGWALRILKKAGSVYRTGWNGKGMYLRLQNPDPRSLMSLPYIFIRTVSGDLAPWTPSQCDILATDWESL